MIKREFLLCRMLRAHAFEIFHPLKDKNPGWGRTFHFRCTRCGTERYDTIDSMGEISVRRYVHPPGYRLTGEERPETADLRLQFMRQLRAERRLRTKRRAS